MRLYKYLYYNLFCLWLRKKDEPENAHINAVISIAFLTCLNIVSIPLILMAVFGKDVITMPQLPSKRIIFIVVITYGIIQYFLLVHKKKYVKIAEEFKSKTEEQNKKGIFYTWLYIIISIGIPLYIFFFTVPK